MRRRMRRAIGFATVVFTVWGGGCLYLAWRCVGTLGLPPAGRDAGWAALAAVAVFVPAAMIRHRRRGVSVGPFQAALVLMSLVAMLVPVSLARDALWLLAWGGDLAAQWLSRPGLPLFADPAARAAAARSLDLGVLAVGALMAAAGYLQARRLPTLRRVELDCPGLPRGLDGFTIAQASDLHAGGTISRARIDAIVGRLNALRADLIALTGDFADGHVADLAERLAPLARLRARHGVFACSGNHEYYWDPRGWLGHLPRLGLTMLSNAHRVVRRRGARLLVAGVPDYAAGETGHGRRPDARAARRGAPRCDFAVLLAHQPGHLKDAARAGFDLVLSGHTHGGQMWPWTRMIRRFHSPLAGLSRLGDTRLYISRGAGYWGPPNRLGVPSEIALITLRRA